MKEANLTGLAIALMEIRDAKQGKSNKATTTILRENGITNFTTDVIDRFVTADTETIDEDFARRVLDFNNERRRKANKQRKLSNKIGMEQAAVKPLPLADKLSDDPLDAYESRQLIENLRKRGYKGELYYTKVYKVSI